MISCHTEVLNVFVFLSFSSESVFKVRRKDMFSVPVEVLTIDFCLASINRLLTYKNSPIGWQASGGREQPVLLHKFRCCPYLFTAHYLFISEQCIHICWHIPNGDKRKKWPEWIIWVLPGFLESLCQCVTQILSPGRNLTFKEEEVSSLFCIHYSAAQLSPGQYRVSSETFKWIKKLGQCVSCLPFLE